MLRFKISSIRLSLRESVSEEKIGEIQRAILDDSEEVYLRAYPEYVNDFFTLLVELSVSLTSGRVQMYLRYGLDINRSVVFYGESSFSYYFFRCFETRHLHNCVVLLRNGADATLLDSGGFNVIENMFLRGTSSLRDIFLCEKLIYMIDRKFPIKDSFRIRDWIKQNFTDVFVRESRFMADVVQMCSSLDSVSSTALADA
jgi:hypothetical protein